MDPHKNNIQLYQFGRAWRQPNGWRLPNGSPFCLKLETYMKMAQIPYEIKITNDPRKGPHEKLPFIRYNGQTIADSERIINFLKEEFGDSLDGHLSDDQKAEMHALRRMMEHHLIGVTAYSRFHDPAGWTLMKKARLKGLPPILGPLIVRIMRKRVLTYLKFLGLTDFTRDEVYQRGKQDLETLSQCLGEKPYFMGDQPTSLDATAFGFLAGLLWDPMPTPLKQDIRSLKNLDEFCERIKQKYYS